MFKTDQVRNPRCAYIVSSTFFDCSSVVSRLTGLILSRFLNEYSFSDKFQEQEIGVEHSIGTNENKRGRKLFKSLISGFVSAFYSFHSAKTDFYVDFISVFAWPVKHEQNFKKGNTPPKFPPHLPIVVI
jgi:hypothetical protein